MSNIEHFLHRIRKGKLLNTPIHPTPPPPQKVLYDELNTTFLILSIWSLNFINHGNPTLYSHPLSKKKKHSIHTQLKFSKKKKKFVFGNLHFNFIFLNIISIDPYLWLKLLPFSSVVVCLLYYALTLSQFFSLIWRRNVGDKVWRVRLVQP